MEAATVSDNIKVAIRVRQLIQKELTGGLKPHWTVTNDTTICCDEPDVAGRKPIPYTFDRVFDDTSVTMEIFEDICKPIVNAALAGINGTIFAYGQSSSGKTFTMLGSKVQPGIISLSVNEVFNAIDSMPDREFLIRVGYLEIYNERVSDLLSPGDNFLKLQEDIDHNIQVVGLTEEMVNDVNSIMAVLQKGNAKRHTAETKQNDRSSRSHCILRIVIESRQVGREDDAVMVSNLYFVDLAGSEKAGDNTGDRFREGCAINKSLFTLGMVIRKLTGDTSQQHASFRDSKLTRILKNALGGNSKTAIICTITPAHIEESDSTLKFASRAKNICNKPTVNEVMSDSALLKRYRSTIKKLEMQIQEMNNTNTNIEKVELEQRLQEKEAAEREQSEIISKLQTMIVTAGTIVREPPKKKRRETWCVGKIKETMTAIPEFSAIADFSPPRPLENMNTTVFNEEPPVTINETIDHNPTIKELFELQDKHELILEEMKKKDSELKELQDFTELERQVEAETIKELREKVQALESNLPWLEEELLKTQQERNSLRQKVETMNMRLTAVEDGSGITEKTKKLSETENINVELNSELDLQKSRYDFHIEQMRRKLETYTLILEEKGVDPESLKQRLASIPDSKISEDTVSKQKEIDDLRHEIDMLVIASEKGKKKIEEMNEQYELEFEEQRVRYQKDLEEMKDEIGIYQQLLQEEKAKSNTSIPPVNNSAPSEMLDEMSKRYESQIAELKGQKDELTKILDSHQTEEKEKCNEKVWFEKEECNAPEMESESDLFTSDTSRPSKKRKVSKHVNFDIGSEVEIQKEFFDQKLQDLKYENDELVTELGEVKSKYEKNISALQIEVDKYNDLYEKEKLKPDTAYHESKTTTIETDGCEQIKEEKQSQGQKAVGLKSLNEENVPEHINKVVSFQDVSGETDQLQVQIKQMEEEHAKEIEQMKEEFKRFVEENFQNTETSSGESERLAEEVTQLKSELKTYVDMCKGMKDSNTSTDLDLRNEMLTAEINELKEKYAKEIEELNACKQLLEEAKVEKETERQITEDKNLRIEMLMVEMNDMKEKYEKELNKINEEMNVNKKDLDEGKAEKELKTQTKENEDRHEKKTSDSDVGRELQLAEMNDLKQEHAKELTKLNEEISIYKQLLKDANTDKEAERQVFENMSNIPKESTDNSDLRSEMLMAEITDLKEKHEKEIREISEELNTYKQLLEEAKVEKETERKMVEHENIPNISQESTTNSDMRSEMLMAEITDLKEKHEKEMGEMIEELNTYKQLLEEIKVEKETERKMVEHENIPNISQESTTNSDMRSEMLMAEITDLKEKHEKEMGEMSEELNAYKQLLEEVKVEKETKREILENENMCDITKESTTNSDMRSEMLMAEITDQKEKHEKEIEEMNEELNAYKQLLEESKVENERKMVDNGNPLNTSQESTTNSDLRSEMLMAEITDLKEKHEKEIGEMSEELNTYKQLLEEIKVEKETERKMVEHENIPNISQESTTNSDMRSEMLMAEITDLKEKHEKEMGEMSEELNTYKQLLEEIKVEKETERKMVEHENIPNISQESTTNSDMRSEMLMAEITDLKEKHEKEMGEMSEELNTYKQLLEEIKVEKETERKMVEHENIPNISQESTTNSDMRSEMLMAEITDLKEKHEKEMGEMSEELNTYKQLLEEIKVEKETERKMVEHENIPNISQESTTNSDMRSEMLMAEITDLKEKHEKEIGEINEELNAYKQLLEEAKTDNETDKQMVGKESRHDLTQENTTNSDLRSEMLMADITHLKEKHEKDLEEINEELNIYKQVLDESKAENETKRQTDDEKLHEKIREIELRHEKEIRDLKEEMEMYQEVAKCPPDNGNLQTEMLATELAQLKEKHSSEVDELNEKIAVYKEMLGESFTTKESSKTDVSVAGDSRPDSETDNKSQENLKHVIEETEKELHYMREQLQRLSEDIERLQAANAALKTEKLDLINAKDQLQGKCDEFEEELRNVQGDLQLQEEENGILKSRISDLEEFIKLGEGMLANKNEEIETLKQGLDEQMATVDAEVAQKTESLQGQCLVLEEKVSALEGELQIQNERVAEFEVTESQFSSQVLNLESELETSKEQENTLTKLCSEYEEKIVTLESDLDLLKSRYQELEDSHSIQEKKLEGLKLDLELAQKEDSELKQVQEKYQEKISGLENELQQAQVQAREIETSKGDLQEKLDLLEKELEEANFKVKTSVKEAEHLDQIKIDLEGANQQVQKYEELIALGKVELENTRSKLEDIEHNYQESSETVQHLNTKLEEAENEKELLKSEIVELSDNTKNLKELSEENIYLKERVEALEKDGQLSSELIAEYDSEVQELKTKLSVMSQNRSKEEETEKLKLVLEKRVEDIELERDLLQSKLDMQKQDIDNRTKAAEKERDSIKTQMEEMKAVLELKVKKLENDGNELRAAIQRLKQEKEQLEKDMETINTERDSLQDDNIQLQNGLDPKAAKDFPQSDSEWEQKWVQFTRDEKIKRLNVIHEIRSLKSELKREVRMRERAKEAALQELIQNGKEKEVISELDEKCRQANEDANRLHSDLEDEKKITTELRENITNLEKQIKEKKGGGFVEFDHNCDFKISNVRLDLELKQAREELSKKVKFYEDLIQDYNDRISKMKNEMRRMQSSEDNSICWSQKPDFENAQPSETRASVLFGSSCRGGIVDLHTLGKMETQNKLLKLEVQQQKKQMMRVEVLDKENISLKVEMKTLKDELKQLKTKTKTPLKETKNTTGKSTGNTSLMNDSLTGLPLAEMMQKATAPEPEVPVHEILERAKNLPMPFSADISSSKKKANKDDLNSCKTS